MTSTPPIKREITPTRRMDDRMSLSDSFMNCRKKILHFSGFLKTFFRKRRYRPIDSKDFFIIIIFVLPSKGTMFYSKSRL